MSYFVTGATGFIGRNLVELLLERNGTVYVLVREGSKGRLEELRNRWGVSEDRVVGVVGDMQRDALVMQLARPDVEGVALVPEPAERLGEIAVPTLAVVGELDIPEMREGAARLAADIPGASAATVAGASHLPSLERPEEFDALVLEFLGGLPD